MNITAPQLRELIAQGAGSHVEFARECPADDALASVLCAFANTRGGWLVVGVDDDRSLHGCADPKDVMTRVRLVAEEDLRPPLNLALSSVRLDEGLVVAVRVNHSRDRPHAVPGDRRQGEILVRAGRSNQIADGATLNALRSHRTQGQPKDPLESKILAWIERYEHESDVIAGDASPEVFSKAFNVGLRRASKAFVSLEKAGLLIGHGDRYHRLYALP